MRTIILTGLTALVVALAPRASQADHTQLIFVDFPELSEWGHVVLIGGVEYWRPYPDLVRADWVPYTDGYLYEDPDEGLVWVSNEPWGVITEHYGYWRHHDRYGYVWRPLYPLEWRPVMTSIFRDRRDYIIGWSPFYYNAWDRGLYVVGWGFDDYYWAPFWGRVCYADFYPYYYHHFYGWHVGVTIYDSHVYYREEPDRCYRRDWEYRERRGHHRRERHDPDLRSLVVREDLESRRRVEAPTRVQETPQPATSRGTVAMTPRSVNPWAPPQVEKKREVPERVRAGFQRTRVSVIADGQQTRNASRLSSPQRSLPSAPAPITTAAPERRAERREAGFVTRPKRPVEVPRSDLQVRSERAAAARTAVTEARAESRPARNMERPAERREAQVAAAAPPVERQSTLAVPRFERQSAPAAPRAEPQPAPAERVRAAFNAARRGRN